MNWFKKIFSRSTNEFTAGEREKIGTFVGLIGIVSNFFLVLVKLLIGYLSGSISIMADAMNNLSDTASSLITIIGFRLAGKPADAEHPYGHARYEYISAFFVSLLIIFIGVEFFRASVSKIINPESVSMSVLLFVVLLISIIVKLLQSVFNKKAGKKINSLPLIATAQDSMNDVYITSVVLISMLIEYLTTLQVDGYVGLLVAGLVVCSGVKALMDTINELLGKLPGKAEIEKIERKLGEYDGVLGFHDLLIHSYGVNRIYATVHADIDAKLNIMEAHDIIDRIEQDFLRDLNINLLIHMDPEITDNPEFNQIRKKITEIVGNEDRRLSFHDLRISERSGRLVIIFDLVLQEDMNTEAIIDSISGKIISIYPVADVTINADQNYIELNIENK